MANDHAQIYSSIWNDRDFLALDQYTQRLYFFLTSQNNLSKAGHLPVTPRRWATSASDLTPGEVLDILGELAAARFVVWDQETEEVLVRTYIRWDKVYRQPNVMQRAVSDAAEIVSPRLRLALLTELDRLPLDEVPDTKPPKGGPSARQTVAGCIETLRRTLFAPAPDPGPEGPGTLPERVPGTLPATPAGTLPGTLNGRVPQTPAETPRGTHRASLPGTPTDSGWFVPHTSEDPQVQESDETLPGTLPETLPGTPPEWVPERHNARAPARVSPNPIDPSPNPSSASLRSAARSGPAGPMLELVPAVADEPARPRTTEELVAYWLENVRVRPPGQVIARIGKSIKAMLAEGVDPDHIAAALPLWVDRGLDPSVLPSVVNQVQNAAPAGASGRPQQQRPGDDLGTPAHMERYLARAAARKAASA